MYIPYTIEKSRIPESDLGLHFKWNCRYFHNRSFNKQNYLMFIRKSSTSPTGQQFKFTHLKFCRFESPEKNISASKI